MASSLLTRLHLRLRQRCTFFLGIIFLQIIVLFFSYFALTFFSSSQAICKYSDSYKCEVNKELTQLYNKLLKENEKYSTLKAIKEIIVQYPCNRSKDIEDVSTELLDVCPEKYMGQKYGYDKFYSTGFNTISCTNVKPFNEMMTILLNNVDNLYSNEYLNRILKGIENTYRNITVFIGSLVMDIIDLNKYDLNIKIFTFSQSMSSGVIWNTLIQHVKTPYVFIGYDIVDFTQYTQLLRLVRVFTQIKDAVVIGGAYRTPDNLWHANCYQLTIENYILQYKEGYYHSEHECMFCNHINGPFLSRKTFLQNISFDISKPSSVLFIDFFLKLKAQGYSIISCPDAMNFVNGDDYFNANHFDWLTVSKSYKLNKIYLSNSKKIEFQCNELEQGCDLLTITKYYMMPPCCREKLVKSISIVHNFLELNNIPYTVMDGTLLGSVKILGVMPWDLDGDLFYDLKYYTIVNEATKFWENQGFEVSTLVLDTLETNRDDLKEIRTRLTFNDMYIELFAIPNGSHFHDNKFAMTKMKFDTIYVYGPTSPGLAARNMYGSEYLKHTQSYLVWGIKSWSDYETAGTFTSCQIPDHHACLDHFPPDGNIQYMVP